jgi:hypothetical protein
MRHPRQTHVNESVTALGNIVRASYTRDPSNPPWFWMTVECNLADAARRGNAYDSTHLFIPTTWKSYSDVELMQAVINEYDAGRLPAPPRSIDENGECAKERTDAIVGELKLLVKKRQVGE